MTKEQVIIRHHQLIGIQGYLRPVKQKLNPILLKFHQETHSVGIWLEIKY